MKTFARRSIRSATPISAAANSSRSSTSGMQGGIWGIEDQFDVVRATFTDGTNVPRIPPLRLGGGVFWRDDNWLMRVNLLHAFAQNDVAVITRRQRRATIC